MNFVLLLYIMPLKRQNANVHKLDTSKIHPASIPAPKLVPEPAPAPKNVGGKSRKSRKSQKSQKKRSNKKSEKKKSVKRR
jgi:hypothetical protein